MATNKSTPQILEPLDDGEAALWSILQDPSGLDQAEFFWYNQDEPDGCWRAWPFQWQWYHCSDPLQIDQMARCLSAGTLIATDRGHLPIESVEIGDRVLTHRGRWQPVTAVWDRGELDVVRVKGHGHPGLVATADHPFLLADSSRGTVRADGHRRIILGEASFRPIGEASPRSTRWASPSCIEAPGSVPPLPDHPYASGQRNVPIINSDFWWLTGLYIAEGSISSSHGRGGVSNRVTFSVHDEEVEVVSLHLKCVGLSFSVETFEDRAGSNVKLNSQPLATWFSEHFGRGSRFKRIPPWVYALDSNDRLTLFRGMTFGDGHQRSEFRNEYTTSSQALAFDAKLLGQSLGFSAALHQSPGGERVIRGRSTISGPSWCVGFQDLSSQRKPHVRIQDGLAWSPLHAIEPAGVVQCWDLSVAEDHSFVAEGVVVHNSVGKSLSIKMRAFAFPFLYPGQEMVITAPELVHLHPITGLVENQFQASRVGREMLPKGRNRGITHRPFQMDFLNGARIMGRIPQRDGKGVKGLHPIWLELDEAQDYPEPGWIELIETLKRGHDGAVWRAHGVTRGMRDHFYKFTQPESGWTVHRITAMSRPNWTDQERQEKIEQYGSKDHPDYRRNVLGLHGDATNPLFVLHRLMACVDSDEASDYNQDEYFQVRVNDEMIRDMGSDILQFLDFPTIHTGPPYIAYWIGMDVGYTNHPSEVLVFGEIRGKPKSKLKLLTRLHLERINHKDQVAAIIWAIDFYRPKAFAMDKTGLGLPLFQDLQNKAEENPRLNKIVDTIKGYNFSSKILVDFDDTIEVDEMMGDPVKEAGIERNVLEYATDKLREFVDHERIILPWDRGLLGEFQGQTFQIVRGAMDQYGRKRYSQGSFHALDAARMAVLGYAQHSIEEFVKNQKEEPVFDMIIG